MAAKSRAWVHSLRRTDMESNQESSAVSERSRVAGGRGYVMGVTNEASRAGCSRCSGELVKVAQHGTIETFRCARCGFELSTHFTPSLEALGEGNEQKVHVVIRWQEKKASLPEIAALRKLLPGLKESPSWHVLQQARDQENWELGLFDYAEAIDLRDQGRELGLIIELL